MKLFFVSRIFTYYFLAMQTDVSKLRAGDIFYRVLQYKVTAVDDDYVHTTSDVAGESIIGLSLVEKSAFTTHQYTEEVKFTRTQLAQKIETLGHAAFRVTFKKLSSPNDVADGLSTADMSTQAKRRKIVKQLMEGEERVLHAKLHRTEDFDAAMELGRYRVIDLEQLLSHGDEKRAYRMIDTRTVTELIVDNVRYYV